MICYLYPEPTYLIFSSDVPLLLYYSHIPTILLFLSIGLYVYFNDRHSLLNKLLLFISLCFSAWITISLIAWTIINAEIIAFIWPLFGVLAGLVSILCIYFVYVFLNKKDVPFSYKVAFTLLLLPLFLFAPTDLSVSGFDLTNCDSFAFEGIAYKVYYTLLGVLAMVWVLVLMVNGYRREVEEDVKKQILYVGIGIELFLFLFFSIVFLITYLVNLGILPDSRLEMYGLFGMVAFMFSIAFTSVKYKAFNVNLAAPVALVIGLWIFVFSLLFIRKIEIVQVIVSVTLFFLFIFGYALIKSIRREIRQRQEIERLAKRLKQANTRLRELDKQKSEFVSIASHQLRSPLTVISGYASMLREGGFGKLPAKAKESTERIYQSARLMTQSIEEYLNVSRIESGNMKYEKVDFNLRNEVERIANDSRQEAIKRGLLLMFKTDMTTSGIVNADVGKVVQAIHNLINNSLKYTPKGSVNVLVRDDQVKKRIYVEVIDTGIGMSEKTLNTIFQKFERADNAHKVNIQGTGLGLYMALKIIEAMGGTITASSEGEGKGSKFVLELPLVM